MSKGRKGKRITRGNSTNPVDTPKRLNVPLKLPSQAVVINYRRTVTFESQCIINWGEADNWGTTYMTSLVNKSAHTNGFDHAIVHSVKVWTTSLPKSEEKGFSRVSLRPGGKYSGVSQFTSFSSSSQQGASLGYSLPGKEVTPIDKTTPLFYYLSNVEWIIVKVDATFL